jgi:uncharacterized membrane protein
MTYVIGVVISALIWALIAGLYTDKLFYRDANPMRSYEKGKGRILDDERVWWYCGAAVCASLAWPIALGGCSSRCRTWWARIWYL